MHPAFLLSLLGVRWNDKNGGEQGTPLLLNGYSTKSRWQSFYPKQNSSPCYLIWGRDQISDMNFRNLPFCACISVRTRVNGRADKSQALPHKSVCRRMQLTINCWPAVTFYLFGTVHTKLLKFSTGCLHQACEVTNYRHERKKKKLVQKPCDRSVHTRIFQKRERDLCFCVCVSGWVEGRGEVKGWICTDQGASMDLKKKKRSS